MCPQKEPARGREGRPRRRYARSEAALAPRNGGERSREGKGPGCGESDQRRPGAARRPDGTHLPRAQHTRAGNADRAAPGGGRRAGIRVPPTARCWALPPRSGAVPAELSTSRWRGAARRARSGTPEGRVAKRACGGRAEHFQRQGASHDARTCARHPERTRNSPLPVPHGYQPVWRPGHGIVDVDPAACLLPNGVDVGAPLRAGGRGGRVPTARGGQKAHGVREGGGPSSRRQAGGQEIKAFRRGRGRGPAWTLTRPIIAAHQGRGAQDPEAGRARRRGLHNYVGGGDRAGRLLNEKAATRLGACCVCTLASATLTMGSFGDRGRSKVGVECRLTGTGVRTPDSVGRHAVVPGPGRRVEVRGTATAGRQTWAGRRGFWRRRCQLQERGKSGLRGRRVSAALCFATQAPRMTAVALQRGGSDELATVSRTGAVLLRGRGRRIAVTPRTVCRRPSEACDAGGDGGPPAVSVYPRGRVCGLACFNVTRVFRAWPGTPCHALPTDQSFQTGLAGPRRTG